MSEELITRICGDYPVDYSKPNIESNPNYIFENDETYNAVQLWDIDGNTILVNSFVECEHYVFGGWSYSGNDIENIELLMQTYIGFAVLSAIIIRAILNYLKR